MKSSYFINVILRERELGKVQLLQNDGLQAAEWPVLFRKL